MFKQHKMYMGFKSSMLRSAKAVDRLLSFRPWLTSSLSSFLMPCCLCPLLFVASERFCSVFDFAHLGIYIFINDKQIILFRAAAQHHASLRD